MKLSMRISTIAALALAMTIASACSSDSKESKPVDSSSTTAASAYSTSLKGVCPDPIVVQTNWYPEPEHGFMYQLIGPNGKIDADKFTYTGPLGSTGVNLEIRGGGPAVGFQQVSSVMSQDDSILLGFVTTDAAVGFSKSNPTMSVFSPHEKNPQIWMWGNPEWNFKSSAEIGEAGVPVLAFGGSPYVDVFIQRGWLKKDQVDTSYKGAPDRFVAADGKVVQQGFVTQEPYFYENVLDAWKKPVKYLLLDKEYPVYDSAVSIRTDKLDANKECLKKLVPLMQQSSIDYLKDPKPINDMLVKYIGQVKGGGFTLSEGGAAYSAETLKKLGIVSNGADGVMGSFEDSRVENLIKELVPVYEAQGKQPKSGLQPSDIVTNEFLDKKIALSN